MVVHHDKPEKAQPIVDAIHKDGGRAIAVGADVRDEAAVDAVFAAARKAFGDPDILVNDAGVDAAGICVDEMEPAASSRT